MTLLSPRKPGGRTLEAPPVAPIRFYAPGVPATGGSKRSFLNPKNGRIVTVDDCKRNKPWREVVASAALQQMNGAAPMDCPLAVSVVFVLPRPPSVKQGKRPHNDRRPDCTKLWRAAEDALTGICWTDDARIVEQKIGKFYNDYMPAGMYADIRPLYLDRGGWMAQEFGELVSSALDREFACAASRDPARTEAR